MARSHTTKQLEQRIVAAMDAAANSVLSGEAKTYDAYRYMCGYISGLSEAVKILDEIEAEYSGERDRPSTSH